MPIRPAALSDAQAISRLLTQLEYPGTPDFLEVRLAAMLRDPAETLLVWEEPARDADPLEGEPLPAGPPRILGVVSLHFIPQLALRGDFARISYFAVDDSARSKGIGRAMEEEATRLAREHGCELLEVHCHSRRTQAHRFYTRQGYEELPKYLIKRL
jgi:GNAT superfamily N-acetyltransferase